MSVGDGERRRNGIGSAPRLPTPFEGALPLAGRFVPLPRPREKLATEAQQQVAKRGHRIPVTEERLSTIENLLLN